jgi:hypothetical protein
MWKKILNMTPTQRLNEIAGRVAGATKGEWEVLYGGNSKSYAVIKGDGLVVTVDKRERFEDPHDDSQLIAHSKSDITWLLEEVRALREALRKYGHHKDRCAMFPIMLTCPTPCDCWFQSALERNEDNE